MHHRSGGASGHRAKDSVTRQVRRRLPSAVLLTRRRALFAPVVAADWVVQRLFPDARPLPPPALRLRVGAWRLGLDQIQYRSFGETLWMQAALEGWITAESQIVELGCGTGRFSEALAFQYWYGSSFRGGYLGLDVDEELLGWARANFPPNFRFELVKTRGRSSLYPSTADPADGGTEHIPLADDSCDFAVSNSLFTHLLEDRTERYLAELQRVLRPGGRTMVTFFCLEHLRDLGLLGGRHRFEHRLGRAWVEDLRYPEAAVAYDEATICQMATAAGFAWVDLRPYQQSAALLVAS